MCQQCPRILDAARSLELAKKLLKSYGSSVEAHLAYCLTLEDRYREAGMSYHCTQIQARQLLHYPEDRLNLLHEYYEITTVGEYNALFEPLKKIITALTDIHYKYIRYTGTAKELVHCVYRELKPAYRALLNDEYNPFCDEISLVIDAAETLFDISRTSYETDEDGQRCAWFDCVGNLAVTDSMPHIMGEEWNTYYDWVRGLPETQQAVQAGRGVVDIALDLLWKEPEGFEN
jgi:hypothetical protein